MLRGRSLPGVVEEVQQGVQGSQIKVRENQGANRGQIIQGPMGTSAFAQRGKSNSRALGVSVPL